MCKLYVRRATSAKAYITQTLSPYMTRNSSTLHTKNWSSNFWIRLVHSVLGKAKPKYSWQQLTVSILLVLNNFVKNLFITKSKSADLTKGHASKPYNRTVIHLLLINCKVDHFLRSEPTNFPKYGIGWAIEGFIGMAKLTFKQPRSYNKDT